MLLEDDGSLFCTSSSENCLDKPFFLEMMLMFPRDGVGDEEVVDKH